VNGRFDQVAEGCRAFRHFCLRTIYWTDQQGQNNVIPMRKILPLVLVCLFINCFAAMADEPTGTMYFKNANLTQMLNFYQQLSGRGLQIEPSVTNLNVHLTLRTTNVVTKNEAIQLIEQTITNQAHVIITKTDEKHASVTLDSAKPSKP
jgi:hypothetical protein